ncbi:hypothetical protein MRB53_041519 [Persea americana]|nr:hypothetical protein MRB53_041519 [Persea americana]
MLERGARASLRHARQVTCSQRLLHSAFWTHGANELDIPPTTPTATISSCNNAAKSDNASTKSEIVSAVTKICEGLLLDFLYPPQALAWARWENRNASRLPQGFIQTRDYSSKATTRKRLRAERKFIKQVDEVSSVGEEQDEPYPVFPGNGQVHARRGRETITSLQDRDENIAPEDQKPTKVDQERAIEFSQHAPDLTRDAHLADGILAESISSVELSHTQSSSARSLLHYIRVVTDQGTAAQSHHVERAWQMYRDIDDRINSNALQSILAFFAASSETAAQDHVIEIYNSISMQLRTLDIYKLACNTFLKLDLTGLAEQTHNEALSRVDGSHALSVSFLRHAIDRRDWDLAYRIKLQLDGNAQGFGRAVVRREVLRKVAQSSDLLSKGTLLARHLRMLRRIGMANDDFEQFSLDFLAEIVIQDLRSNCNIFYRQRTRKDPRSKRNASIFFILRTTEEQCSRHQSARFVSSVADAILRPDSKIDFDGARQLVDKLYLALLRSKQLSETLLAALLDKVILSKQKRTAAQRVVQLPSERHSPTQYRSNNRTVGGKSRSSEP